MENTGYFALAAYHTRPDLRETFLKCSPVVERAALEAIFDGSVAEVMTRRNLSFGVAGECALAHGFDRGHCGLPVVEDETRHEHDCDCNPREGRGKQIDGPPAPPIPIRKLGHLSAVDAERLVVPQVRLTREQRARARETDFNGERLRVSRYLVNEEVELDLQPGQMQQMILRVSGISDPSRAYPVQVRYFGRSSDDEKVIGEFVVLFLRRHDPFPRTAQTR